MNDMDTMILQVLSQSDTKMVDSRKADGEKLATCTIDFKALGGDKAEKFTATMFGNMATTRYFVGETVAVNLWFDTHEYGQRHYQDVRVVDIRKIGK